MLDEISLAETGMPFMEQSGEVREGLLGMLWSHGFEQIAEIWNRDFRYELHVRLPGYFMKPISLSVFEDWMETWPFERETGITQ